MPPCIQKRKRYGKTSRIVAYLKFAEYIEWSLCSHISNQSLWFRSSATLETSSGLGMGPLFDKSTSWLHSPQYARLEKGVQYANSDLSRSWKRNPSLSKIFQSCLAPHPLMPNAILETENDPVSLGRLFQGVDSKKLCRCQRLRLQGDISSLRETEQNFIMFLTAVTGETGMSCHHPSDSSLAIPDSRHKASMQSDNRNAKNHHQSTSHFE